MHAPRTSTRETARHSNMPLLTFSEHSLCYIRSSMRSAGEEDHPAPATRQGHPDHRPPRVTSRDRRARGRPPPPFRNLDSPPAAVRPPPSPLCSVYHSLSLVPVGAVTPHGGHGPPASGLLARRGRAHRAPSGRRRVPGGLPARGGGGRRRGGPPAVRRARVPRIPDVRRVRARHRAVSVRGVRARAPGAVFV